MGPGFLFHFYTYFLVKWSWCPLSRPPAVQTLDTEQQKHSRLQSPPLCNRNKTDMKTFLCLVFFFFFLVSFAVKLEHVCAFRTFAENLCVCLVCFFLCCRFFLCAANVPGRTGAAPEQQMMPVRTGWVSVGGSHSSVWGRGQTTAAVQWELIRFQH